MLEIGSAVNQCQGRRTAVIVWALSWLAHMHSGCMHSFTGMRRMATLSPMTFRQQAAVTCSQMCSVCRS